MKCSQCERKAEVYPVSYIHAVLDAKCDGCGGLGTVFPEETFCRKCEGRGIFEVEHLGERLTVRFESHPVCKKHGRRVPWSELLDRRWKEIESYFQQRNKRPCARSKIACLTTPIRIDPKGNVARPVIPGSGRPSSKGTSG